MAIPIIKPTVDPFTSEGIEIDGDLIGCTIITNGLSSGEEIGIEINNGFGWEQIRVGQNDFKVTFALPHTLKIEGRGLLRFVKAATVNPVSLALSAKDNV